MHNPHIGAQGSHHPVAGVQEAAAQRVLVQIWLRQRGQKSFPHPLLDIYQVWKTTAQQTAFFALPGLPKDPTETNQ